MQFPSLFRVRQRFDSPRVDKLDDVVEAELARLRLGEAIRPGARVAITAGSRGIANISRILRGIVGHLRRLGAEPFVVPAMGSHGGATVAGQLAVLAGYDVTEHALGCPISATMETRVIATTDDGIALHFDRIAADADHVFVVGRVRPHTMFSGEVESGLMKMLIIGLGKHVGAEAYHRAVRDHGFAHIVTTVGREALARCRVVGGLAIVDNTEHETALIRAAAPAELERVDRELLILARQWMAKLPFGDADVVVVDEIGKNISGVGMDPNVLGRKGARDGSRESPRITRVVVRSLSAATRGNATGLGLADFCTTRAVEQTDRTATNINCLTSGNPEAAKIPCHFASDREAIAAALSTLGARPPELATLLWIRNTLDLAEVECSSAYLDRTRERDDLTILCEPRPMPFDDQGNLADL